MALIFKGGNQGFLETYNKSPWANIGNKDYTQITLLSTYGLSEGKSVIWSTGLENTPYSNLAYLEIEKDPIHKIKITFSSANYNKRVSTLNVDYEDKLVLIAQQTKQDPHNTQAAYHRSVLMLCDRSNNIVWENVSPWDYISDCKYAHSNNNKMLFGSDFGGEHRFKGALYSHIVLNEVLGTENLKWLVSGGLQIDNLHRESLVRVWDFNPVSVPTSSLPMQVVPNILRDKITGESLKLYNPTSFIDGVFELGATLPSDYYNPVKILSLDSPVIERGASFEMYLLPQIQVKNTSRVDVVLGNSNDLDVGAKNCVIYSSLPTIIECNPYLINLVGTNGEVFLQNSVNMPATPPSVDINTSSCIVVENRYEYINCNVVELSLSFSPCEVDSKDIVNCNVVDIPVIPLKGGVAEEGLVVVDCVPSDISVEESYYTYSNEVFLRGTKVDLGVEEKECLVNLYGAYNVDVDKVDIDITVKDSTIHLKPSSIFYCNPVDLSIENVSSTLVGKSSFTISFIPYSFTFAPHKLNVILEGEVILNTTTQDLDVITKDCNIIEEPTEYLSCIPDSVDILESEATLNLQSTYTLSFIPYSFTFKPYQVGADLSMYINTNVCDVNINTKNTSQIEEGIYVLDCSPEDISLSTNVSDVVERPTLYLVCSPSSLEVNTKHSTENLEGSLVLNCNIYDLNIESRASKILSLILCEANDLGIETKDIVVKQDKSIFIRCNPYDLLLEEKDSSLVRLNPKIYQWGGEVVLHYDITEIILSEDDNVIELFQNERDVNLNS